MSKENNTLKKEENQYHHLTEKDRATIQTLIEQKDKNGKRLFNNSYIANYIGVHRSTISRELRKRKSYRFMVRSGRMIEKPYNAKDAQHNYLFKRGLSKGEYKLRKYSKKDTKSLSASKIPYSIENRPEEINNRCIFGHFEIDTVIGTRRGKHECLLTFTERKTKFEIIFKLSSKTSENVVNKINQLKVFMKSHYNKIFKSFSTDNGSEFSDFLDIIKDTKTQIYFCHPYCSGEKGTNEKHNGIIRYFIPKGTLIENYTCEDINNIASWMNNYPRKILEKF